MVVLKEECKCKIRGGGCRDRLTENGIETIHFLHQLIESIHTKRLHGDRSIPSIAVDDRVVSRLNGVLNGGEVLDDWCSLMAIFNV